MWKTDCEHHNGKCRSPSFYVLADLTYRDLGMAWLGAVAGRWHVENCEVRHRELIYIPTDKYM
jgi:hypothetical protein